MASASMAAQRADLSVGPLERETMARVRRRLIPLLFSLLTTPHISTA